MGWCIYFENDEDPNAGMFFGPYESESVAAQIMQHHDTVEMIATSEPYTDIRLVYVNPPEILLVDTMDWYVPPMKENNSGKEASGSGDGAGNP